jgi:hypothetical protein
MAGWQIGSKKMEDTAFSVLHLHSFAKKYRKINLQLRISPTKSDFGNHIYQPYKSVDDLRKGIEEGSRDEV